MILEREIEEEEVGDFEELKTRWQREIESGRLEEAEAIIQQALAWAREHGDFRQVDSAICASAAVAIHLGRGESELSRLREILLRNADPGNCRLAAYHLSIYYQFAKNHKKSLFYARIAFDRSKLLGRNEWIAYSHNQVGNALLGESFIEAACAEYERALDLMPAEVSMWRARTLTNLGYCRILQKRYREGYTLLYESLRLAQRFGSPLFEITPRLDLCFAHLETERYRHAERQGLAALALAERLGQTDGIKNALYLLGETANLTGDSEAAYDYFSRLQRDFYPDSGYLPEFLLAVDVRKLVNLHA
jgi:Tfp pilus assembly protein PilF